MDPRLAKEIGVLTVFLFSLAPLYYILRTFLVQGAKNPSLQPYVTEYQPVLKKAVVLSRQWHARLALTATALALVHGASMLSIIKRMGPTSQKGLAALTAILCMLALGLLIMFKPDYLRARIWHRRGMYLTAILILAHIL